MPRVSRFIKATQSSSSSSRAVLSLLSSLALPLIDNQSTAGQDATNDVEQMTMVSEEEKKLEDPAVDGELNLKDDTTTTTALTPLSMSASAELEGGEEVDQLQSAPAPVDAAETERQLAFQAEIRKMLEEIQKSQASQYYKVKAMREQLQAKLDLWNEHCSKYEEKYQSKDLQEKIQTRMELVKETLEKGEDAGVAIKELESAIVELSDFRKSKFLSEDMDEDQILEAANLSMRDLLASSVKQAELEEAKLEPSPNKYDFFSSLFNLNRDGKTTEEESTMPSLNDDEALSQDGAASFADAFNSNETAFADEAFAV